MRRHILPATAALALLLVGATTGCSSAPQLDRTDCGPALSEGSLSNSVTVEGKAGSVPKATVPKGVSIEDSQRTIVSHTGDSTTVARDGALLSINMQAIDAETGQTVHQSQRMGTENPSEFVLLKKGSGIPALTDGLRCTAPGDRVVVAMEPKESAQLLEQSGAKSGGSVVFIVDVLAVRNTGNVASPGTLPSGFPAVTNLDSGRPGIVLPPQAAPKSVKTATRIEGDGLRVTADNNVIAQVLTVDWDGQEQNNTWTTGPVGLGNEAQMSQSGVTFRKQLTGLRVGSQVVIMEPQASGKATVSVVDILAAG
ncbi:peptidylprolyl isomerase [Leucobacter sp. HNU]|uniref:peptidylprolyl isomerase n=1 Tax=Leucobacter sp. HNU TaxID=3236805 RepID=UPI003A807A0A